MHLKFYVPNGMEKLKETLQTGFEVRSHGGARPGEIAFFKDGNSRGFCFSAHKFFPEEIPVEVCNTPFLVKTGNRWTEEGLIHVITGYASFRIPSLCGKSDGELLEICRACVSLPWGGIPQGKNKQLLTKWLRKADRCFPREDIIREMMSHNGIRKLRIALSV